MVPTFVFSRSDFQNAPAPVCLAITQQECEDFSHPRANPPLHPHHRSRMLAGLPLENFFRRIRRGLRRLHQLIAVMRRSVDGVELERVMPGADQVVVRAGGDDDAVACPDLVGHPVDHDQALAVLDAKELIRLGMDFSDWKSTRLNSSHRNTSRMPSSA